MTSSTVQQPVYTCAMSQFYPNIVEIHEKYQNYLNHRLKIVNLLLVNVREYIFTYEKKSSSFPPHLLCWGQAGDHGHPSVEEGGHYGRAALVLR